MGTRTALFPRLLLACLVIQAGCSGSADGGAGTGPLEVRPRILELPPVPFGGREEGVYRLRNIGDRSLRILRIGPTGCGCAVPRLELPARSGPERDLRLDLGEVEVTLAPGEEAILHLALDTSRFREPVSRRHGSFPIVLDGHPPLVLEYTADIWTPVQVEPWAVDLGRVGVREQPVASVLVKGHDAPHFRLLPPAEADGWRVDAVPLPGGEVDLWRVTVTAPPELPEGPFHQEFRIPLDLPRALPVRFTVMGVAGPDLVWTPTRLFFPPEGGRLALDLRLRLRARGATLPPPEVEILPEGGGESGLALEVAPDEPGRSYRVRLIRLAGPPAAPRRGVLRIHTSWEEQPVVEVPWFLAPAPPGDGG